MHFHFPHPHIDRHELMTHFVDVMNVLLIVLGLLVALMAAGGYTPAD